MPEPGSTGIDRARAALERALALAERELTRLEAEHAACLGGREKFLGMNDLRACVGTIRQASDGLAALRPRKPRG